MSGCTSIIQCGEDARRATLFDKVAYDLVVKVLNRRPLDLLPYVFFLFRLQRQFDKNLLQLLIDVVDAQLLERIVLRRMRGRCKRGPRCISHLKDLKAEDILRNKTGKRESRGKLRRYVRGFRLTELWLLEVS